MDYEKYINLLFEKKYQEALKYKNDSIPSRLYKYISLKDDSVYQFEKSNEKRFNTLERLQLQLDTYDSYNDPF